MTVAIVVAGTPLFGISTLTNTLVDKLLPSNDGSNFGEETLNNSTIGHEEKNNRSATFLFDFENGNTSLIIILICGIVTFLLGIGCCIFFCGCSRFGCRKSNTTRGQEFYREQFYATQCQVNNAAQVIEMTSRQEIRSTEHDDIYQFYRTQFYANKNRINNENSQDTNNDTIPKYEYPKFEDNGRKEQYDDQIEEIVQFPNVSQAVYTVISKNKKKNRATDDGN